ncbi:curli polymerization inhibitor CsgI-related protein [Testudinibacter sp. P80/BLE/0925]|uniref:curli polymerization inhibitor CsgI-related protein n=1 Tax=Testudinibacter sp. TW-1 TaxID=3417757 RepID=UPI003D35DFFF
MKLAHLAISAVALLTGFSAVAAEISTSSNLEILAVDGQKAGGGLLKKNKTVTVADNETHQVVVRVAEIIRSGSDRRLFESAPVIVRFKAGSENIQIKADGVLDESDAARFDKNPKVSVVTASGQAVASEQDILSQDGLFPGRNIAEDLSSYNSSGGKAAVAGFASASMPVAMGMANVGKASKGQVTVQGENVAEQQLQYWFQQADKATQQRFLNWAKKQ